MIIIDGSHLLHRCLHTQQRELKDSHGRPTGGIHGFLASLHGLCRRRRFQEGIVVAWDLGVPLVRREIDRNYKPNKVPVGNDIDPHFLSEVNISEQQDDGSDPSFIEAYGFSRDVLHRCILPLSGCISIQVPNCEADDIIAYWSRHTKEPSTILSGDGDMHQLVNEYVEIYDPMKKEFFNEESISNSRGLDTEDWRRNWLWRKAVLGDSSDGVPGFEGIGGVAATSYGDQIHQYVNKMGMSVEDAVASLERPPRALAKGLESIQSDYERVEKNYKLVDLYYPMDIGHDMVDDIVSQFALSANYEMDEFIVESKMDDLELKKAKEFVMSIRESNLNDNPVDHLHAMAFSK